MHGLTGAELGNALERYIHAVLDPCDITVRPCTLAGDAAPSLRLHAHYMLPFNKVAEAVTRHGSPVLYKPEVSNYPVDGIIVPQLDDGDGAPNQSVAPIVVVEISITPPRDGERLKKYQKWFESGSGVIDELKAAHRHRKIVVALFSDKPLRRVRSDAEEYKYLLKAAAAAGVDVVVLDRACLMEMRIAL